MSLGFFVRLFAVAAVAITLSTGAAARTAPYVAPTPVGVPAGLTKEKVREAVIRVLPNRAWVAKEVAADELEVTHHRDPHSLTLRIRFEDMQVVMSYKDSTNLNYGMVDGKVVAHPTVMFWMRNLRGDIAAALSSAALLNK